jgi:hypothetical protein
VIRLSLLVIALLMAPPAAAQPATGSIPAGDILRGVFVQERHLQGFGAPIRSSGNFILVPGRGLIWQLEQPFKVTTVITPGTLVQYTDDVETLRLPTRRIPALGRLYDMLSSAMAGDWRDLENDFTVTRQAAGPGQQVTLVPRGTVDAGSPIKVIRARAATFVEQVEIERPSGDVDRIAFAEQTLAAGPPAPREAALFDQASR